MKTHDTPTFQYQADDAEPGEENEKEQQVRVEIISVT